MSVYVITEGPSDQAVLQAIWRFRLRSQEGLVISTAGGKSNASSLARSLLAKRHEPVALVLDADAVDEDIVGEQQSNFETSLGLAAEPGLWKVILFKPALEIAFFHDPCIMQRLLGYKLAPEELELARLAPKKMLAKLSRQTGQGASVMDLATRIDADTAALLLESPDLKELTEFVADAQEAEKAQVHLASG